jgi:hypothetical protein
MHMNLRMADISLVNEGYLSVNSTGFAFDPTLNTSLYEQVITRYTSDFMASATSLSKAQTGISITTSSYEAASKLKINPDNVVLQYFDSNSTTMPSSYTFNIWEAVL